MSPLLIDDELLVRLRNIAEKKNRSVTELATEYLREAVSAEERPPFKQRTFPLGAKFDVDKAQAHADELYDRESIKKFKSGQ